ncbi:cell division protein FtsL [Maritalea sp.]|uniref:cell division protein FtsL n=1 Tax=Maritalea sp. TaxID=2003361 RepID=UPI003EF42A99
MRAFNFLLLCTSFVALILVYGQKYRTEDVQSQVIELQRDITSQKQILNSLDADWAYLNQPARLQSIVDRHAETLGIAPIVVAQYGSLSDVPMRPAAPDSDGLDALLMSLEAGIDPNDQEELVGQ